MNRIFGKLTELKNGIHGFRIIRHVLLKQILVIDKSISLHSAYEITTLLL